ncbi:hypothetical protein LXL04_012668 [Taraxacum kok-saghyz]
MIKHCGGPAVVRRWSNVPMGVGGAPTVVRRWSGGGPAVVRWWSGVASVLADTDLEEQLEDTSVSLDNNATVTSINASYTTDRERSFAGMIDRALEKEFTENDQNEVVIRKSVYIDDLCNFLKRRRDVVGVVAAVRTIFVDASLTVERLLHYASKVLLRSELILSSTEERALLKNLGGWLGKITIDWLVLTKESSQGEAKDWELNSYKNEEEKTYSMNYLEKLKERSC